MAQATVPTDVRDGARTLRLRRSGGERAAARRTWGVDVKLVRTMESSGRIAERFAVCKKAGRPALVAYLTAGDPHLGRTPALALALERGGADVLELGVPFSDPIADGPVIQQSSDRALKAGTDVA